WFTYTCDTTSLDGSNWKLCSAFAIAELSSFSTIGDADFGVWRRIAIASPPCLPRIKSTTTCAFRGAIRTWLTLALACCMVEPPLIHFRTACYRAAGSLSSARFFIVGCMAFVRTRRREFAELMSDHVLRYVYRHV